MTTNRADVLNRRAAQLRSLVAALRAMGEWRALRETQRELAGLLRASSVQQQGGK